MVPDLPKSFYGSLQLQAKETQNHPDCSEHSSNCHLAPRWGLTQETCRGHGSAKSEAMMSGGGKEEPQVEEDLPLSSAGKDLERNALQYSR